MLIASYVRGQNNGWVSIRMVNCSAKNFTHQSCLLVMSCWDSHVDVHSWIGSQILNITVMRSRSMGMPFKLLGLSFQRKNNLKFSHPFEKKKIHLLGQQWFSIQNLKLSLLNSRGFPYGKGNPITFSFSRHFRFALLSHSCHWAPLFLGI